MMRLKNILVPTDLSQRSKRALRYALSLATEYNASITVLHVDSWELYSDEFSIMVPLGRAWPADRVMAEASLELSNFLEPYSDTIKRLPAVSKRIVLGPIVDEIVSAAEDLQADLIVMSPRRLRGLKRILTPSITDHGYANKSLSGSVCHRSPSLPAMAREADNKTIRLAKTGSCQFVAHRNMKNSFFTYAYARTTNQSRHSGVDQQLDSAWQNFDALVFFNRVMDLFFKLLIFFVVIVLGMGLVRLFWETWRIMAASELKEAFSFTVTNLLTFFIILELFKSLVEYFREHRLKLTFIIDATLVFILREVMISLYQHQSTPLLIMALALLALVLGAVRTLAIIYSPMERTMVERLALNSRKPSPH